MERFIPVALGDGQPVTQSLGVGLVHVGDDGVSLPALLLLLVERRIQDDADGKEIINALKSRMLLLHLLRNGVDGLGAPLHVELQSRLLQLLAYRLDEGSYVTVT